jgi:hypothetical protein
MHPLDVELFETKPDQDLQCPICLGVFKDPVETTGCRHVFCRECITEWLTAGGWTCPTCRADLPLSGIRDASPALCSLVGRLKMRCVNAAEGCEARVTVAGLGTHLRVECQLAVEQCQCGEDVARRDRRQHAETCSRREVMCQGDCRLFVCVGDMATHDCTLARRLHDERKSMICMIFTAHSKLHG